MNGETLHLCEFGGFRLNARKKTLWYDGAPVPMPLKELELLCVLIENRGELVTKEELLDKVWEESFVEESNLSRHIYLLRKTLKNFGESEEFIQNVPRRGYRFMGNVRQIGSGEVIIEKHTQTRTLIEIQDEDEFSQRKHTNRKTIFSKNPRVAAPFLAALLVALFGAAGFLGYQNWQAKTSVSEIKSIAVLPFKTINGEKTDEHQGLGLADVLITRLSNIKEINVRPTNAVLSFENQEQDSIVYGEKLNVDAVLEGTIYRTNDKVRVTARLLKVSDQSPIWAGQFETTLHDELRLQDEIALQLVDALALNLSGSEKNALTKRYTESADAYQFYLKGRYEWNKRSWAGAIEAERLFRNAIEKDPNFTLAYVGLADTLAMSIDRSTEAFGAIQKSLERDPNLAEAHATLGFLKMFHRWQWQEAESAFVKSIELNPNYATAHHWYAEVLAIQGKNEEAKAVMRRALEINPLSYNFLADLGQIYYFVGEYKEAEEYCRQALEINPDFQFAHDYLRAIYIQTGEYDKAFESELAAQKIFGLFANESAERKKSLEAYLDTQRKIYREGGIRKYAESQTVESHDPAVNYGSATRYAFLGEKEKALDCLEKAYAGKAFGVAFIKADRVFDGLRDEPRYREILRKMSLAG